MSDLIEELKVWLRTTLPLITEDETGNEYASAIETLQQELLASSAKVDALMLEYCPEEMTKEQILNYELYQRSHK